MAIGQYKENSMTTRQVGVHYLQGDPAGPDVHFETRERLQSIGNLGRLECWCSLTGVASVIPRKCIDGLKGQWSTIRCLLWETSN